MTIVPLVLLNLDTLFLFNELEDTKLWRRALIGILRKGHRLMSQYQDGFRNLFPHISDGPIPVDHTGARYIL